jgi:hypothetical protein
METIQIEIRNKNALSILKGLERAKIIKLIETKNSNENSPVNYKGAFSRERAIEMIQHIEKSRNEWDERTI